MVKSSIPTRNGDRRHLLQQNLAWYARVAVPLDLQRLFRERPDARPAGIGKSEAVVALHTRDLREAQQRRWAAVTAIKQRFDELRTRYLSSHDDDGRRAFEQTLKRLQGEREDWNEDSFEDLRDRLSDASDDERYARREFNGGPGTPVFDAYAEFLRPGYADPTRYAPPVSEIAERYLKDRARDPDARVTDQTLNQEEAVLELFAAWHQSPLAKVTGAVATSFLDTIAGLDPLWARSPGKRSATLGALQARSLVAHEEGLSNRTINRYVSTMASFMDWASKRYPGVDKEAFAGHWRKASSHRKTGWLPMTDDEILAILDHVDQLPQDDPMFWLPRIGAYQGMRLNEVCSLKVHDVITRDGLTCFSITNAKTEAGDRVIPVHSRVLRSGLLAYLASMLPGGLLFPTLTPGGPDSKLSWRISPEFTRLRRRLGITRNRVSFHSLRKSMATKLERARVPENEAVQLLGHEKLSMSYRVYSLGVDLPRLKELVELVDYHRQGDEDD
jgi:integrase